MWDNLYPHIHTLPDSRTIYLHCPHEFIPTDYINKPSFLDEWVSINQNKQITINYNNNISYNSSFINYDVYYASISYCDDLFDYHTNRQKRQIKKLNTYHVIKSKLNTKWFLANRKPTMVNQKHIQGTTSLTKTNTSDDENSKKEDEEEESGGVGYEFVLSWYVNGQFNYQLKSKNSYFDGEIHGLQESWYEDGKPKKQVNYKNVKYDGLYQCWHANDSSQNGQLADKHNYIDWKRHGLYES